MTSTLQSNNYDIQEFYVNAPPHTKSMLLSTTDKYHNYTMRSYFNVSTINYTALTAPYGWYDNSGDLIQELSFKYYIETSDSVFLIKPLTKGLETLTFMIPFVANSYIFTECYVYVLAQDKYAATAYMYYTIGLTNTYTPDLKQYWLLQFDQMNLNGTLASDTYYQLMVANFIAVAFD